MSEGPIPWTTTLGRYRHLVAVGAAIVLLAVLRPADPGSTALGAGMGTGPDGTAAALDGSGPGDGLVTDTIGPDGTSGVGSVDASTGAAGPRGTASGRSTAGRSAPTAPTAPGAATAGNLVANCDAATGRVKIPTIYAAPCVAAFSGDNGGATSSGVTKDAIKVVYYKPQVDPAVGAALTAAGASDSWENIYATFQDYVKLFAAHYSTWGRKIDIVVKEASGAATDDAAVQADAIDIATRLKPFLVTAPVDGSVSNVFAETLASRKVVCICGVSKPQEFYEKRSPYLGYTTLMSATQGYVHRAEYVCKRLARRPAAHAGFRDSPADPMSDEQRKFALLYLDNEARDYTSGADFFMAQMKQCGVPVLRIEYAFNAATLQEQAASQISRMKADGITSVIFSGDPIAPAVMTKEATNQRWFPEWIVTGSALTDTNLFGRTYDQAQWQRAFGISYGAALFDNTLSDPYALHEWHHGRPPAARNVYSTIYTTVFTTLTGIHLAGANLTPATFQAGLFGYKPSGGGPTAPLVSYGRHGYWSNVDLTAWDDITEVWWDVNAVGPDQTGKNGRGMYRYIDGGRRYLPGKQPTTPPKAFVAEGAPTFLATRPPSDKGPTYPTPAR